MPFGEAPVTKAGLPLIISPEVVFAINVDGVPETPVPDFGVGRIDGATVIVAFELAQLAGVFLSHNSYGKIYAPGATVLATETLPVAAFRLKPAGQVPITPTRAVLELPATTAAVPLTLSLAEMSEMGVEAVPETALPVSGVGKIVAVTVMITVVGAQLIGVLLSQS